MPKLGFVSGLMREANEVIYIRQLATKAAISSNLCWQSRWFEILASFVVSHLSTQIANGQLLFREPDLTSDRFNTKSACYVSQFWYCQATE